MKLSKLFSWFGSKKEMPPKPEAPTLRVRFSEAADKSTIVKYYADNQHQHVYQRKEELLNERTENGRIIIVEDKDANIGFTTISYDFTDDKGDVRWIELGSTITQQDSTREPYELVKGLNLYPAIISSQTIYEFLTQTPKDKPVASIFEDNGAVIHLLSNKVGWDFFEPSQALIEAKNGTKGTGNTHVTSTGEKWLAATTNTLPRQARTVLEFIEQGTTEGLYNKRTDSYIKLDTSRFALANEFRAAVEALAYGPLADHLEQNPHIGMDKAKELLDQHLKGQKPDTVWQNILQ